MSWIRSHDQVEGGDGDVAGGTDGCEQRHVPPLRRAVKRALERVEVIDFEVAHVDAVLGEERRRLLHEVVGHARGELDLGRPRWWLPVAASQVGHGPSLAGSGRLADVTSA